MPNSASLGSVGTEIKVQKHVLIAEDNASLAESFSESLKQSDFRVTVACTVEAAVHQLAAVEFNVLLLDLELGGRRGLDVLEFLSVSLKSPPTTIVVTSPSGELMDDQSLNGVATAKLVMPFEIEALLSAIRSGEKA